MKHRIHHAERTYGLTHKNILTYHTDRQYFRVQTITCSSETVSEQHENEVDTRKEPS